MMAERTDTTEPDTNGPIAPASALLGPLSSRVIPSLGAESPAQQRGPYVRLLTQVNGPRAFEGPVSRSSDMIPA